MSEIIRVEEPRDFAAVENIVREAFWNVYRLGCTEHYVLHRFRSENAFIPELSLVLEVDGRIIGHIMYARAELVRADGSRVPSWTFGPISIHPDFQHRGYGVRLLRSSLEKARSLGVGFLCMEGNLAFYQHAGFRPARMSLRFAIIRATMRRFFSLRSSSLSGARRIA